ncbi:hypothetical protein [Pseudoalteromonas mariniglutinosa]|uniref:hypothetical protein n=1 Tax=Pseudoalteromonas mariniglutinosa TaxID=206042 RepID=UPI00384CDD98
MMKKTDSTKLASLLFSLIFLTGCNDYFITDGTSTFSAWQPLLIIATSCLVFIPVLSLALLIFSQWKHIQFKITLQRYFHGSLILMLAIAWFIEVGLVQRTDNRVDLLLTLCALGTQMALVAFAFVRINKQQKMLYRANNFL